MLVSGNYYQYYFILLKTSLRSFFLQFANIMDCRIANTKPLGIYRSRSHILPYNIHMICGRTFLSYIPSAVLPGFSPNCCFILCVVIVVFLRIVTEFSDFFLGFSFLVQSAASTQLDSSYKIIKKKPFTYTATHYLIPKIIIYIPSSNNYLFIFYKLNEIQLRMAYNSSEISTCKSLIRNYNNFFLFIKVITFFF